MCNCKIPYSNNTIAFSKYCYLKNHVNREKVRKHLSNIIWSLGDCFACLKNKMRRGLQVICVYILKIKSLFPYNKGKMIEAISVNVQKYSMIHSQDSTCLNLNVRKVVTVPTELHWKMVLLQLLSMVLLLATFL